MSDIKEKNIKDIILRWDWPFTKPTRMLDLYVNIDSYPSCTLVVGGAIPFIINTRLTIIFSMAFWNKYFEKNKPKKSLCYSFTINDKFISFVFEDMLNKKSKEIQWRDYLFNLFHRVEGKIENVNDWCSTISPIESVGSYKKEVVIGKIREVRIIEDSVDWIFFKKRSTETSFEITVDGGVTVPADYNVNNDEIVTRTVIHGVGSHVEAMAKFRDIIIERRKARSINS